MKASYKNLEGSDTSSQKGNPEDYGLDSCQTY